MLSIKRLATLIIILMAFPPAGHCEQTLGDAVFTAVDVETTGLSPTRNRIIEISTIRFCGTNVGTCSTWLINPEASIPAESTKIHGITDEMVADSPKYSEIADKILTSLSNSVIVAHNAPFDWKFIQAEFKRANRPPPEAKVIDSIRLARIAYPDVSSYALKNLQMELKLDHEPTHRAESDTKTLVSLVQRCIERIGTNSSVNALDKYAITNMTPQAEDETGQSVK